MESVNFVDFLNWGLDYGHIHCPDFGDDKGNGYGAGVGDGAGDCNGDSAGAGSVDGNGYGDGAGSGAGNSFGKGYGCCRGHSLDIKSYNGKPVYNIDGMATTIVKIRKNIAKGFIINEDLTTKKCYVAKGNGYYAHGLTLREAVEALRNKIYANMDTEEAIQCFLEAFPDGKNIRQEIFILGTTGLLAHAKWGGTLSVRKME